MNLCGSQSALADARLARLPEEVYESAASTLDEWIAHRNQLTLAIESKVSFCVFPLAFRFVCYVGSVHSWSGNLCEIIPPASAKRSSWSGSLVRNFFFLSNRSGLTVSDLLHKLKELEARLFAAIELRRLGNLLLGYYYFFSVWFRPDSFRFFQSMVRPMSKGCKNLKHVLKKPKI